MKLLKELEGHVSNLLKEDVGENRKVILDVLTSYIVKSIKDNGEVHLNFICTHNSRRSQFSQVWSQVASDFYGLPISCYSGGVEETAFNERAVASLQRIGFEISSVGGSNPKYEVKYSEEKNEVVAFSKLYDDKVNPMGKFAAVMTCSHADENCPFIPGTEARIPLRYEDPKEFDDTPLESAKYDERSKEIAVELFCVMKEVASLIES